MEFLKNFGLDPIHLVFQVLNFLVVFYILKRFLYKPVLELFKKRQDTIREGLEQAKEASTRLEKVINEEKNILRVAQAQAKKIIEDARSEATEISKQIAQTSKKQTEKMLKDAYDQIKRESLETEKRLAVKVSNLAVSFLQKSLGEFFSSGQQKEIVQGALKKIRKDN